MDKILDFLGLGDMSVITPGKVLFLAGAALLVVTIIVAIVFRLRRLRYDPSQAVYAMGDATAPMNNQYPTRRGTPGSTASQGTASLQGEAVPNQTSGQMGPGQTAARTAGRTGTVPLQGSPFPEQTARQGAPGQTAARTAGRTGTVPLQGSPFPEQTARQGTPGRTGTMPPQQGPGPSAPPQAPGGTAPFRYPPAPPGQGTAPMPQTPPPAQSAPAGEPRPRRASPPVTAPMPHNGPTDGGP